MELDKQKIKEIIREELIKVEQDIVVLRDFTQPISPENAIGRVSRMDAINNKSINEASLRKSEEKLNKLKVALSKVDDKDFGICIRCKRPIPVGRILLMPQSNKCVNCA
ncbi:transcriptional regulator, TraR/DksA family [Reichenbachiella faecimaris]|uniref:Transcriptional regulator, TraR/DksA family n=1 Tax=Reichenbachiella faecimaris TaxID=692418 RepID=A0A1W2G679_REIFA|nr:TraR/DksA C4-type zinc finger protein [Reichenbachiella faecimaris]SMD31952.1 transcriptional regulator, TraR/DksA family [Reichenbachiella faecimaris]